MRARSYTRQATVPIHESVRDSLIFFLVLNQKVILCYTKYHSSHDDFLSIFVNFICVFPYNASINRLRILHGRRSPHIRSIHHYSVDMACRCSLKSALI